VRRRRSRSSRLYIVVSVVLAVVAGVAVHAHLSRVAVATGRGGEYRTVVVASGPIHRGATIRRQNLRPIRFPEAYAPPGSFSGVDQAAGRVALADLARGEAVTETRLARVRAGPVASLIPQGLRAFAVPTSLPLGSLAAGDRVDILATYSGGEPHTETVVTGVEVLFVLGRSSSHSGPSTGLDLDAAAAGAGDSITLILLVSSDQEERLAFARAFADLQVAIAPPLATTP
jgi:Flp pilus assembly protein CpaB